MRELNCAADAARYCALVEPRYLAPPARRFPDARARINAVARTLDSRETARVDAYHREVARARATFREQLAAEGLRGTELARSDFDYV